MSSPRNENLRSMANGLARREVVVIKPEPDEDLRRLCISLVTVMKRKWPDDYRRLIREMDEKIAA